MTGTIMATQKSLQSTGPQQPSLHSGLSIAAQPEEAGWNFMCKSVVLFTEVKVIFMPMLPQIVFFSFDTTTVTLPPCNFAGFFFALAISCLHHVFSCCGKAYCQCCHHKLFSSKCQHCWGNSNHPVWLLVSNQQCPLQQLSGDATKVTPASWLFFICDIWIDACSGATIGSLIVLFCFVLFYGYSTIYWCRVTTLMACHCLYDQCNSGTLMIGFCQHGCHSKQVIFCLCCTAGHCLVFHFLIDVKCSKKALFQHCCLRLILVDDGEMDKKVGVFWE